MKKVILAAILWCSVNALANNDGTGFDSSGGYILSQCVGISGNIKGVTLFKGDRIMIQVQLKQLDLSYDIIPKNLQGTHVSDIAGTYKEIVSVKDPSENFSYESSGAMAKSNTTFKFLYESKKQAIFEVKTAIKITRAGKVQGILGMGIGEAKNGPVFKAQGIISCFNSAAF